MVYCDGLCFGVLILNEEKKEEEVEILILFLIKWLEILVVDVVWF